jgi:hypothetical protein
MMPLAQNAGVTHLRFPAGEWGDGNDIQSYHLDPFIALARQWKAEPSISVRLKNGTPEKAIALLKYTNVEKGYNVRYWSIGNEPDLFGGGYTAEQHAKEWRVIAEAMLAVDPAIQFIGPDVSQYPPTETGDDYNNVRREWVRTFLKANADLVAVVSIHRYPFPKTKAADTTTIAQLRESAPEWDTIIPNLRSVIREAAGRDLPVAITEINSHWNHVFSGAASPDSHFNAVWWADVLGRMIRQRVDIVNYFALSTASEPFGLLARYEPRPTYFTYQLYKAFGETLLPSASDDPHVTITAALRKDGALTLMVVNLGEEPADVRIALNGVTPSAPSDVWRLDLDHNAVQIAPQDLSAAISLPEQSVTLYVVLPS